MNEKDSLGVPSPHKKRFAVIRSFSRSSASQNHRVVGAIQSLSRSEATGGLNADEGENKRMNAKNFLRSPPLPQKKICSDPLVFVVIASQLIV
jgi:hypothetical protein